jgi:hypothetical protein
MDRSANLMKVSLEAATLNCWNLLALYILCPRILLQLLCASILQNSVCLRCPQFYMIPVIQIYQVGLQLNVTSVLHLPFNFTQRSPLTFELDPQYLVHVRFA